MSTPRHARGKEPAYPQPEGEALHRDDRGLTIREYAVIHFAGCMCPEWAQTNTHQPKWADRVAELADALADAVLARLALKPAEAGATGLDHIEPEELIDLAETGSQIEAAYRRAQEGQP